MVVSLTRETNYSDIIDEEEDKMKKNVKRGSMIDTYTAELSICLILHPPISLRL